jgi:hypothetical protein
MGVGVVAGAAVYPLRGVAYGEGLAGLDVQLTGTGRVGTLAPEGGHIAPASDGGAPPGSRDPTPAHIRTDGEAATRAGDRGNWEVALTEAKVAACHLEVARRRHLPPAKIAARTVVLRFTIEKSGRVRDAEALSADGTDLEVAACAKRVLSEWVFAKRAQGGTVVERTYRFGPSS